jgi:hypothetical protein
MAPATLARPGARTTKGTFVIDDSLPQGAARPYRRKLGPEQEAEIGRLYAAGRTSTALAAEWGESVNLILAVVRRQGVLIRKGGGPRALSLEQEARVCERYADGESATKLAREVGLSAGGVRNILLRGGVTLRSQSECRRKYDCNHNFFDSIDTQEKSYWLGFLAADGHVHGNKRLSVKLSAKDRSHIELFSAYLKSNHPIAVYDTHGRPGWPVSRMAHLQINSQQLCEDLTRHGVTPRKTLTLEWPHDLDEDLLRHYLRGYFDGDGCFSLARFKKPQLASQLIFVLTGNRVFLEAAQDFLMEQAGVRKNKIRKAGNVGALAYQGNRQVRRIHDLMYEGATVWLPRKRDVVIKRLGLVA